MAHVEYSEGEAADVWSSKGVGYVRVENPGTGRRHNVFFTHMQSSYSEDHDPASNYWSGLDVRTAQFNEVKHLIELARQGSDAVLTGEDIFVLGDLYVDGDLSNVDSGFGAPTSPYDGNKSEWRIRFKKGGPGAGYEHGGFFNQEVHDTWAYEHPSFDTEQNPSAGTEYGHTGGFGSDPTRLDYILSNAAFASDDPLCNQHPHIAYSLLSGDPIFPGHGATPPG